MTPSFVGNDVTVELKGKVWIITESSIVRNDNLVTLEKENSSKSDVSLGSVSSLSLNQSENASVSLPLSSGDKILFEDDLDVVVTGGRDETVNVDNLPLIRCQLCSYVFLTEDNLSDHVNKEHKSDDIVSEPVPSSGSVHINPEWKDNFRTNFTAIVTHNCSTVTRNAIDTNEKIEDVRKLKKVRKEVVDIVVDHLLDIHGTVSNPRLKDMRIVAIILGDKYPSMFRDNGVSDASKLGYGLGGSRGLQQLPEHLVDKVRHLQSKKRKVEESSSKNLTEDESESSSAAKKGKKPLVYGVDNRKFYGGGRNDAGEVAIGHTKDNDEFHAREKVFERNRQTLQYQFRLL